MRCVLLVAVAVLTSSATAEKKITWKRVKLDERFRSEGVAVADVNKDGKLDVIAGDVWYEAPKWTVHEIRKPGNFVAGKGYSNSFVNFARDINGDGWVDLILIGFPGKPYHWYENPRNKPGHWKEHVIENSATNESPEFEDLTGDGKPEIVLGSQPQNQIGYVTLPEAANAAKKWSLKFISTPGDPHKNGTFRYYHGIGVGDVNSDGKSDVMIPHGWWQQPAKQNGKPWEFHKWQLKDEKGNVQTRGANMYADDLDLDGDADILLSSPHGFGFWWFERTGNKDNPQYKGHLISRKFSQLHAVERADIDGDGDLDYVTGKRFYAHNGRDPGGKDPVVMYWFEVQRNKSGPKFIAHEILAGRDTGVGTQFEINDINKDGLPDIILSNKKGVNILLQQRAK